LITKLYQNEYGCEPAESPRQLETKAPEAPDRELAQKAKHDKDEDENSDDEYDFDDFEDEGKGDKAKDIDVERDLDDAFGADKNNKKKDDVATALKKQQDELDDLDDWDMDDDVNLNGKKQEEKKKIELDDAKKNEGVNAKEIAEKKRRDLFFGGGNDDDLDVMEDLDMLGGKDFDNKNEDKFNQVLSTSKENGGLLASIGLKKGDHDESIGDESQE